MNKNSENVPKSINRDRSSRNKANTEVEVIKTIETIGE
jgi:hypothetical protein